MTCREKLMIEHPDNIDRESLGGCVGCPSDYGYFRDACSKRMYATDKECRMCWDREIPGTEERKFYTCTEISKMTDFEKNGLVARLQSDIANTDVECINLKNRLRAKDVVIDGLRSTNDTLEERIKMFEKNVEKLEKEKDDLDCVLHNKIEELEYEIELKNKNLEYENDYIDHLVKRLNDQRKKIEDLENGDVLPYFIRKVVGDKLKEDTCCWATSAEKRTYIGDSICKSIPCSEAIKQLEKKVDDIPCIKAKIKPVDKFITSCWNDGSSTKAKEAYDYIIEDMKRTREFYDKYCVCKWNITDPPYNKIAEHMMRKYQALRHVGFDHDTALSFIPMWSDD